MSGVPREIDETAFLDGYSFPRFFVRIFIPLIASGIGVAAFFCFMFSVGRVAAGPQRSPTTKSISSIMTRTVSARDRLGPAFCGGRSDLNSGGTRDLVRARLHRQGLRPWPRLGGFRGRRLDGLDLADRSVVRVPGVDACGHDCSCGISAGDASLRRVERADHARRPFVHIAARCRLPASRLDRNGRRRHHR